MSHHPHQEKIQCIPAQFQVLPDQTLLFLLNQAFTLSLFLALPVLLAWPTLLQLVLRLFCFLLTLQGLQDHRIPQERVRLSLMQSVRGKSSTRRPFPLLLLAVTDPALAVPLKTVTCRSTFHLHNLSIHHLLHHLDHFISFIPLDTIKKKKKKKRLLMKTRQGAHDQEEDQEGDQEEEEEGREGLRCRGFGSENVQIVLVGRGRDRAVVIVVRTDQTETTIALPLGIFACS
jgi:hypothetical protein